MTWEREVKAKSKVDIKALARRHGRAAIKVLATVMNQADGPVTARVSAAQALLDRGCGKTAPAPAGEDGNAAVVARVQRVIIFAGQNEQNAKNRDRTGARGGARSQD